MKSSSGTESGVRWYERLCLFAASSLLLGLLGTAYRLSPHPAGYGTHRQLGLPPCTVQQAWGIRCPACGMTTAWSHVTRGELVAAVRCNATGTWLAILAGTVSIAALYVAVRGRWPDRRLSENSIMWTCVATVVAILVEWSLRLAGDKWGS